MTSGGNTAGCSGEQAWVQLIFILFNSVSESFDSTQLMTLDGFTSLDPNQLTIQNGCLKVVSNQFTTQKAFQNLDSNQLMAHDAIHSQYHLIFFGHSTLLLTWYGIFLGFPLKYWLRMTFWVFDSNTSLTNWLESSHKSSGFSRYWLRINSWLKWIPRYYSDRLMTQNTSRFFNSNQLMTQLKAFGSESTHDSTLSHIWGRAPRYS